MVDRQSQTIDL